MAATLAVIMPIYNALGIARASAEFLVKTGLSADQIHLSDDHSTDPHLPDFCSWALDSGFHWNSNPTNFGYTRNINLALRKIDADRILILNSDCFITARTIHRLSSVLDQCDQFAVVGPLSNNASNQTVPLGIPVEWEFLESDEMAGRIAHCEAALQHKYGERPVFVPSVNGYCSLWRRRALEQIEYFDEELFPRGYGEEDDACFRALDRGLLPVVAPHLFAVHLRTRSFSVTEKGKLKEAAIAKLDARHSTRFRNRVLKTFDKHPLFRQIRADILS